MKLITSSIRIIYDWILKIPGLPCWVMAFIASLLSVTYSLIFKWSEFCVVKISEYNPYLFLVITPIGFFLAWFFVWYFAPNATGSGIPQVMAMIEINEQKRTTVNRVLGIRTTLIKILSSFICILVGGAIGREGPTVQISASVFNVLGSKLKKIFKEISYESLLVAGGAAGIAAAFNTPLGGIVYAVEELSQTHINKFKTALITAVIIAGITAQWLLGPYLYLGYPKLGPLLFKNIPWAILIGVLAGISGAGFGKLLYKALSLRKKIKKPTTLATLAIFTGLVFAILVIFVDQRGLGSGKELMTNLLFSPQSIHITDIKLFIVRFFGPILSQISGAAGGIFAPSLAAGASIGSILSYFSGAEYHNLFVVLGMIAFLTGVTRAPFTSFVLVLEMTDRHSVIFLMMIAALIASLASRTIDNLSFYERVRNDFLSKIKNQDV